MGDRDNSKHCIIKIYISILFLQELKEDDANTHDSDPDDDISDDVEESDKDSNVNEKKSETPTLRKRTKKASKI